MASVSAQTALATKNAREGAMCLSSAQLKTESQSISLSFLPLLSCLSTYRSIYLQNCLTST